MSDDPEDGPVEMWNVTGRPMLLKMGPRLAIDARLNECRAQQAEAEAAELREKLDRQQRKDLYDRVIEKYNRSKSHRKKTTWQEICDQEGVSYENLKRYRSRKRKGKT